LKFHPDRRAVWQGAEANMALANIITVLSRASEEQKKPAAAAKLQEANRRGGIELRSERWLGCHSSIRSVMFSMPLSSFGGMMARVMMMTCGGVSVMSGLLVVSTFVVLGCFLVVVGCFLVVLCCVAVMFGCFL
jgi:hypothetical protein